ncbi:MAG: hypothetical protein ACREAY_10415 [Nitrososphaera sp.]|uniref:hypothetical protein n=1 Tax=Nitrososphaera sp. TaxID=1971748 RepID=UPI003D7012FE
MPQANKRLPLPFGITFEDWGAMIVAMLKTGPQPAFAGRIAEATGLDEHTIGDNVAFLKALGMATPGSTEPRIYLSKAGARYAQALVSGDKANQRKVLAESAGAAFRPVVRFCELAGNLDFDRLFLQIKFLANVDDAWGQHRDTAEKDRAGIYTAIAIMVAAGMLDKSYLPVEEEEAA